MCPIGHTQTEETRAKISQSMKGRILSESSKQKIRDANVKIFSGDGRLAGKNHPAYKTGNCKCSYPSEFNEALRKSIRDRDGHTCRACGKSEKVNGRALDVHHIDYDIDNNSRRNLISLCRLCHLETKDNREYWISYFTEEWSGVKCTLA